MATMLQYECPACGGRLEFDSSLQQMKCPYCETTFEVETLRDYDQVLREEAPQEEMHWQTGQGQTWQEQEGMHVFSCSACGGEILTDATTAATHCPYCGNPVVLSGRLTGDLKPDYVIPFKLSKEDAKDALRRHMTGKRLLPKFFRDEAHLDEIKGVYVPVWLFDAQADAHARYHATRVHTWRDSRFIYTDTHHYALVRAGTVSAQRVPVDGSSKMADDLMESIEPFDFSQAVDFQTAYLSGYLADRYDVTMEQSIQRANRRIRTTAEEALRETISSYHTVTPESSTVNLLHGQAKYALYPVWLLTTSWQGKTYHFAMNGQTGRFVGDLPMDKGAYYKYLALWTAILGAASYGVYWLLTLGGFL